MDMMDMDMDMDMDMEACTQHNAPELFFSLSFSLFAYSSRHCHSLVLLTF